MNRENGDISGLTAFCPSMPVKYRMPDVSVTAYWAVLTGLRSKSVRLFNSPNPPRVTVPVVLSPKTRRSIFTGTSVGIKGVG